jgi:LPS-assembly lipoprotein
LAVALALVVGGCQVRPLYMGAVSGSPVSPVPDLRAIVIEPPRDRTEQVVRNELLFLFRGDGGAAEEERYRLRILVDDTTDPLAVELEEDLPSAVLVTLTATFILTAIETDRTLLTGSSTGSASYDFSSQRFANVRAEKDARERAARTMAENIASRIAAYFAAKRSES